MKHIFHRIKWLAFGLSLTFFLIACNGEKKNTVKLNEEGFRAGMHDYKSIIRLWPVHHEDPAMLERLVQAFQQYPGACDEVWFCTIGDPMDMERHYQSAKAMGEAARALKAIGVRPSIQTVLLGHNEPPENWNQPSAYPWNAIVSVDGISGRTQSCPRQPEYLERISDIQAIYAKEVQPYSFFVDDDLRVTNHDPAMFICFCDTCLKLFNQENGFRYTRETLAKALKNNDGAGDIRKRWIHFQQESLAGVARIVSKKVHEVSPHTQMGLQHANFHTNLMEGYDWNKIFDAMEEETGVVPGSRPGHGYYNDHAPRDMFWKGLGIARQIRRLNENIIDISPEIEGYVHKATGKSSQGYCTETLLYLAYGATQMSYAMICGANEPVEWYADHHFKMLDKYHRNFEEFVNFNKGTQPGGLDPYISPNHVYRNVEPGEDPWAWTTTDAGVSSCDVTVLGLPFAPEGDYATALYIDALALQGISNEELTELLHTRNILTDQRTWEGIQKRNLDETLTAVDTPEELKPEALSKIHPLCFRTSTGKRLAVIPAFTFDVTNAERRQILRVADWVSEGKLPVIMESPAQGVVIPRIDAANHLRSVTYVNCTISEQDDVQLRLRGCPNGKNTKATWKYADQKDVPLKTEWKNGEVIVKLPSIPGWHIGWIAIE